MKFAQACARATMFPSVGDSKIAVVYHRHIKLNYPQHKVLGKFEFTIHSDSYANSYLTQALGSPIDIRLPFGCPLVLQELSYRRDGARLLDQL